MKLVISATSKETAEKALNEHHFSTTFKIEDETVSNKNGLLPHYKVEYKRGRVLVYRVS